MSLRAERRQNTVAAYTLLAPYLAAFAVFLVYPAVHGLYLSFTDFRLGRLKFNWVGLDNYRFILTDPLFHTTVKNTAVFVLESTPLLVFIPLVLAVLLNQRIPLRNFLRGAFVVPFTLSVTIVSIVWWWMLDSNVGLLNYYLRQWGLNPPAWLTHPTWAMVAVVLTTVWWTAGYNLVLFLAGLQSIPQHLYEAARIDGANAWHQFRAITLPLLRPTMLFVLVMQVIASFQVFGQVYVMTAGGPGDATRTVIQYVYETAFVGQRMGEGSAAAWILFVIMAVFSVIQFRFLSGHTEY